MFIDLHVLVDGRQSLFEAHALTETIEGVIQAIAPRADVTVHLPDMPVKLANRFDELFLSNYGALTRVIWRVVGDAGLAEGIGCRRPFGSCIAIRRPIESQSCQGGCTGPGSGWLWTISGMRKRARTL